MAARPDEAGTIIKFHSIALMDGPLGVPIDTKVSFGGHDTERRAWGHVQQGAAVWRQNAIAARQFPLLMDVIKSREQRVYFDAGDLVIW